MTKRSTIGTNPLDEVIPNPLEATISDQHGGKEPTTYQERKKQEDVDSSAGEHPAANPVPRGENEAVPQTQASQGSDPQRNAKIPPEDVAQPGHPAIEVLQPSGQLAERLSELEQENCCLKWALGLILAPLVLLALLG